MSDEAPSASPSESGVVPQGAIGALPPVFPRAASVLIVDDDEALGKTVLLILRKAGYDSILATTGEDAVAQARSAAAAGKFLHAALIDLKLPDMSGLDVLREIKKMHPDAGAVIMTGFADTDTAVGALNDGAFAYLLKPCAMTDVKAVLARAVERFRLLEENRDLLKALREANTALEGKVAARTDELRHTNLQLMETIEKLREADETKSQFVSMVSHELGTPLTIIIGFADTFLRQGPTASEEQKRHYVEIIREGAQRLARLIESMLNLAHIRDKRIRLEYVKFDLQVVMNGVVEGLKITRPDMRFETTCDPEVQEIFADRDRVEQIFVNLIGNAAKYTPSGGLIKVAARLKGSDILASVTDSGPGIPESEREKIFDAFYRTRDAVNMKTPGTGLGLTITKALVKLMGGQVWVESPESGKGTTFVFSLPKDGKSA